MAQGYGSGGDRHQESRLIGVVDSSNPNTVIPVTDTMLGGGGPGAIQSNLPGIPLQTASVYIASTKAAQTDSNLNEDADVRAANLNQLEVQGFEFSFSREHIFMLSRYDSNWVKIADYTNVNLFLVGGAPGAQIITVTPSPNFAVTDNFILYLRMPERKLGHYDIIAQSINVADATYNHYVSMRGWGQNVIRLVTDAAPGSVQMRIFGSLEQRIGLATGAQYDDITLDTFGVIYFDNTLKNTHVINDVLGALGSFRWLKFEIIVNGGGGAASYSIEQRKVGI